MLFQLNAIKPLVGLELKRFPYTLVTGLKTN